MWYFNRLVHHIPNWSCVYQISINSLISKPRKVTHGVPQGLFLVHSYSISIYFPYLKLLTNTPTIDL